MNTYGDGGYFFLQQVGSPEQVVSSYGDGGYFFLQPVGSPKQVVSSYGAFHAEHGVGYGTAPAVYIKSTDEACKAKLETWSATKKQIQQMSAQKKSTAAGKASVEFLRNLEAELIESGCLKKASGGTKERPQDTIDDKKEAGLDVGEATFWDQYGTMILVGTGVLAAAGLGYAAYRALK